jgi:hypothetical protein
VSTEDRVKTAAATIIDRSQEAVWEFCAVDHLRNHPRWDPQMQLEAVTHGPMGLGKQIRRRHTRLGQPIEGVMEVVEWDPPSSFATRIVDQTATGSLTVYSRMMMTPEGASRTRLAIELELPGATASMDPGMVQATLGRIKELVEAETPGA